MSNNKYDYNGIYSNLCVDMCHDPRGHKHLEYEFEYADYYTYYRDNHNNIHFVKNDNK